jgi:apolipoprotein N-acyltransferase
VGHSRPLVDESRMGVRRSVGPIARRLCLVAVSVGLHTLALPPWDVSVLAWIALVPFLLALGDLRPGVGFLYGLLWGTAAIWGLGYWVPFALSFYWGQPMWFGVLFSLAASIMFAGLYYAGFAACACWAGARCDGIRRALLVAALWVSWELARAQLLTGDPWLLLGYALVPHPRLIQTADLGGVFLLSFVVVLVNACLVEALRMRGGGLAATGRVLAPGAAALALSLAYGTARLAAPPTGESPLSVLVVQGNNDPGRQWRAEYDGAGLQHYLQLSTAASAQPPAPELIVWPESAVTFFLAREPVYRAQIARALRSTGADLIVGGPHVEDPDPARPEYFNSAFYVTSDGRLSGRYDKNHLLPFAEYFPLRTIEFLRRRFERVRTFRPGDGDTPLDTRFGKIATVICFEGIFPDVVRRQMANGASILLNLSNDSWLGTGAGPEQHLAMVTLRAVENRTWLVRATTTGVSAIVDPVGRVRARTATATPGILRALISPLRVETVYQRWGDWFAYTCIAASAVALIALARVRPTNAADGR